MKCLWVPSCALKSCQMVTVVLKAWIIMLLLVYVLGISDTRCQQVNNRALLRTSCFKEMDFSVSEQLTFVSLA